MSSNVESEFRNDLVETIKKTQALLYENKEDWSSRYKKYATDIGDNLCSIEFVRKSFHQWNPLTVYLNTTSARNAKNTVLFELRYYGQTVAKLTGFESGKHKLSTKDYEGKNLRDFGCEIQLKGVDWVGKEAREFRKFFQERKGSRIVTKGKTKNEEARLESLWLSELQKGKSKALPNAIPVMIGRVRFPIPTPLSASQIGKSVKYSGFRGGGIDILARVGTGGPNTFLCIIELKDENVRSEPPKQALRQAIAYTTFIRELLRSKSGLNWWRLFGFSGEIPKKLILYAACLMPNSEYNDYSFKDIELSIKDEDIVKLHYAYFTEMDNEITAVDTSLKWL